jgi:hypothetical protein
VSGASKVPTHFDKAFAAACTLFAAEEQRAVTPFGKRDELSRTIRAETAKLERLTERDREMTQLLTNYLRQHGGAMRSYQDFADWCAGQGKLTGIDLRTIQYWLQRQYGARGEPGKPGRPTTGPAPTSIKLPMPIKLNRFGFFLIV